MARINEAFGKKLHALRVKHKLSLRGMEIRLGAWAQEHNKDSVTYSYLSAIERGIIPRRDVVVSIAECFGENVGEWLAEAGYSRDNGLDAEAKTVLASRIDDLSTRLATVEKQLDEARDLIGVLFKHREAADN